jgi:hypothetical protein
MFGRFLIALAALVLLALFGNTVNAGSYLVTANGDSVNCHPGSLTPNITVQEGEQVNLTFRVNETRSWQFSSPVWGGTLTVPGNGGQGTVSFTAPGASFAFDAGYLSDGCKKVWPAVFVHPLPRTPPPPPPPPDHELDPLGVFGRPFVGGSNSTVQIVPERPQVEKALIGDRTAGVLGDEVEGDLDKPEEEPEDRPNQLLLIAIAGFAALLAAGAAFMYWSLRRRAAKRFHQEI